MSYCTFTNIWKILEDIRKHKNSREASIMFSQATWALRCEQHLFLERPVATNKVQSCKAEYHNTKSFYILTLYNKRMDHSYWEWSLAWATQKNLWEGNKIPYLTYLMLCCYNTQDYFHLLFHLLIQKQKPFI